MKMEEHLKIVMRFEEEFEPEKDLTGWEEWEEAESILMTGYDCGEHLHFCGAHVVTIMDEMIGSFSVVCPFCKKILIIIDFEDIIPARLIPDIEHEEDDHRLDLPTVGEKLVKRLYQIKVTLENVSPPVWRRIQLPSDTTLPDLHRIIQTTMGWTNSHMHQFIIGSKIYGSPDKDNLMKIVDYGNTKLYAVLSQKKKKIEYEYDFGDGWSHSIVFEKTLESNITSRAPVCIDGKRNCPPEDCGGPFGYQELLNILNNPKHKEFKETVEWLGKFDPEAFDMDSVNKRLKKKNFGT